MAISDKGLELVKQWEGYRAEPYYATDAEKARGLLTIGYGDTSGELSSVSPEEAEKRLRKRLNELDIGVDNLPQALEDSVRSLVYNIGEAAWKKSKAYKALKRGDVDTFKKEAFDPKIGFVRQNGKILPGLVNRRRAELSYMMGAPSIEPYMVAGMAVKQLPNKSEKKKLPAKRRRSIQKRNTRVAPKSRAITPYISEGEYIPRVNAPQTGYASSAPRAPIEGTATRINPSLTSPRQALQAPRPGMPTTPPQKYLSNPKFIEWARANPKLASAVTQMGPKSAQFLRGLGVPATIAAIIASDMMSENSFLDALAEQTAEQGKRFDQAYEKEGIWGVLKQLGSEIRSGYQDIADMVMQPQAMPLIPAEAQQVVKDRLGPQQEALLPPIPENVSIQPVDAAKRESPVSGEVGLLKVAPEPEPAPAPEQPKRSTPEGFWGLLDWGDDSVIQYQYR